MEYIPKLKWRYPFALEKGYYKLLKNYINSIFNAYHKKADYVTALIVNNSIKLDSDDEVADFMDSLASDIPTPESMRPAISNTFDIVNGFNKKQFEDVLSSVRVNALSSDIWYRNYSKQWIAENLNLIKSIGDDTLRRIESELRDAISTTVEGGIKLKYLENKIKELTGVTDRRAKLIARDQVGKLNGIITQYRQEGVGIKKYTWRTMGDSRVRDSHSERDGKIFEWEHAPEGGHPGRAIRCRCIAQPVIDFDKLAESGAYVPRANREAVRKAMKRWGVNKGELYKKVVGADPVSTNPPIVKSPTPEVPKPVTAEPPPKVEPPVVKESPQTKVPTQHTKPAEVTKSAEPPKVVQAKKTKKITAKAIIEKYAERLKARNVVIDHKFAGYDKRMIVVMLKQFEMLLDKFPAVKLGNESHPFKIKSMAGGNNASASITFSYAVGNLELSLKKSELSKFWKIRGRSKTKKNFNIYTTKQGVARVVIAHEFGHVVHNHLLATKIGLEAIRSHAWPKDYRKSLIEDFVKEIKQKAIELNNGDSVDIYMSKYGDSSPSEWFAEAFCHAMMTSNKEMSPIGKAMLWYLKKEGLLYDDAT